VNSENVEFLEGAPEAEIDISAPLAKTLERYRAAHFMLLGAAVVLFGVAFTSLIFRASPLAATQEPLPWLTMWCLQLSATIALGIYAIVSSPFRALTLHSRLSYALPTLWVGWLSLVAFVILLLAARATTIWPSTLLVIVAGIALFATHYTSSRRVPHELFP
jgi:hypothetical protein